MGVVVITTQYGSTTSKLLATVLSGEELGQEMMHAGHSHVTCPGNGSVIGAPAPDCSLKQLPQKLMTFEVKMGRGSGGGGGITILA